MPMASATIATCPSSTRSFSRAAGRDVIVTFTPHLVPMNRGILSTIYVRGLKAMPQDLHALLLKAYAKEPVRPHAAVRQDASDPARARFQHDLHRRCRRPHSRPRYHRRGARQLTKGASGQAVQNMNLMLGFPETMGLEQVALFP